MRLCYAGQPTRKAKKICTGIKIIGMPFLGGFTVGKQTLEEFKIICKKKR